MVQEIPIIENQLEYTETHLGHILSIWLISLTSHLYD